MSENRETPDPFSRHFADRLQIMIDVELLAADVFESSADATIARLESPPHWILELSLSKCKSDALVAIAGFVNVECNVALFGEARTNETVAAIYVRYLKRQIPWTSFLRHAGKASDASDSGLHDCEYFYSLLSHYQAAHSSASTELQQEHEILPQYADWIKSIERTYENIEKQIPPLSSSKA